MSNIYLIGNKDVKAFKENNIPVETEELPIDEMRFEVLRNDIILYCFDKLSYLEHGDIIVFNKYYYQGDYYTSYEKLIDYMVEHNVLEMNIDTVSFMMVNNKETEEVLYFYHTASGLIKLKDIKKQLNNLQFDSVFIPAQKSTFFHQRKLSLKEIKNLYKKRNEVCSYDTLNYVFHKVLNDDENCHIISYNVIRDYCKNNEKVDLFY